MKALVIGAVLVVGVAGLAGCASTNNASTPTPTKAAPAAAVKCLDDGISVKPQVIEASGDGVRLRVTSSAPKGTYLNFEWPGGGGGDPVDASAMWLTLNAPPGEVTLKCSTSEKAVTLKVIDPHGYWQSTTLAEQGCNPGPYLDTNIVAGRGAQTEESTVKSVVAAWNAQASSANKVTNFKLADAGYVGSRARTWIVSDESRPRMTVVVTNVAGGFKAFPDRLCES